jgi:hypothetical protein
MGAKPTIIGLRGRRPGQRRNNHPVQPRRNVAEAGGEGLVRVGTRS